MHHTDRSQRGEAERLEERLAKEHICIAHGHRTQCGEGGGEGAGWRGELGGGRKWRTSVIVSTIKIKKLTSQSINKMRTNMVLLKMEKENAWQKIQPMANS